MNELYLVRAQIFEDLSDFKKGAKWVIKNTKFIVDDVRRNELLVRLYMKSGLTRKAIEHLEELVQLNSCNSDYYKGILEANGLDL
jgi:hypothetical protein